ncbi:MAG: ABC transporter substrate-binding protein [Armatimonadetes bacterium]|nr:ABC transporter substrate-binding protein [Armatimonadota bacterium]MBI3078450.1 ABC transporter substrate-binding protein [Deltaproteobacteria bacterium]
MSARHRIGFVVVILGTLILGRDGGAQGLKPVKFGYLPVISFAPIFISIDKGYFEGQGIKVGLEQFTTAARMNTALAVGELQVASGTASAGLFNAIAGGMDFKIVADKGQIRPGYSYVMLVVRKDLLDRGVVKSVADLKGMRIALPGKGIVNHYILGKMLGADGVGEEAVRLVFLGMPNFPQAFASGAIEAGMAIEPWGILLKNQGRALVLRRPEELAGLQRLQVAVIIYGGKFIREDRQTAERFMKAYLAGVKFHNLRGIKDPEVLEIVAKYTKVPVPTIKQAVPFYLADDGMPLVESLADQQAWYLAQGLVKEKVAMDRAVDLSFLR